MISAPCSIALSAFSKVAALPLAIDILLSNNASSKGSRLTPTILPVKNFILFITLMFSSFENPKTIGLSVSYKFNRITSDPNAAASSALLTSINIGVIIPIISDTIVLPSPAAILCNFWNLSIFFRSFASKSNILLIIKTSVYCNPMGAYAPIGL